MALARSRWSGNSATIIARITEAERAAPRPWTKRAAISISWEPAVPHRTEAMVNSVTPVRKTFLRPIRSLSRPASRRAPPKVIRYVALAQLGERTCISQQEMGSMLCVDANNLVILLNELEADGLVLRRRDPSDRRRHLVDITPEGRQSLERAERGIATVEDEVLGALCPDERASLQRLLAKAIEGAPVDAPVY
jgi:DNA-binding MarR family transcriptional regulator